MFIAELSRRFPSRVQQNTFQSGEAYRLDFPIGQKVDSLLNENFCMLRLPALQQHTHCHTLASRDRLACTSEHQLLPHSTTAPLCTMLPIINTVWPSHAAVMPFTTRNLNPHSSSAHYCPNSESSVKEMGELIMQTLQRLSFLKEHINQAHALFFTLPDQCTCCAPLCEMWT